MSKKNAATVSYSVDEFEEFVLEMVHHPLPETPEGAKHAGDPSVSSENGVARGRKRKPASSTKKEGATRRKR